VFKLCDNPHNLTSLQSFCLVLHRIFTAVASFLQCKPSEYEQDGSSVENAASLVGLASQACTTVKGISFGSVGNSVFMSCYCSCLSFLTCVVELMASKADRNLLSSLLQKLKDQEVVQIVTQNTKAMVKADSNLSSSQWYLSISLLGGLAKCGTLPALLLLDSCDIFQILWIEIPDDTKQNVQFSLEFGVSRLPPHLHSKLTFLAEWLRSVNLLVESKSGFGELSHKLNGPILNFVRHYRYELMQSLTSVHSTLISLESLANALPFLTILVEFCRSNGIYILTQHSPELHTAIHAALLSMLSCLGIFLGASSAGRDVFRRTDHIGEADGFDPFSSFGSNSSHQPFLKGGLQNTRHEAVRYSHFVSRMSGRIFPKSFNKDFAGETSPGSNSMTALENACRSIVCQDFEKLESKVSNGLPNDRTFCLYLIKTFSLSCRRHHASS
jgi:hypothetical protein